MNENYDQSFELYEEGKKAFDKGQFESAVKLFKESNECYPHFKTLELWGEAEIQQCNFKNAITPLAAAISLNSGIRALSLLASTFLALKDKGNSEKFALLTLEKAPNNKLAKNVLLSIEKI